MAISNTTVQVPVANFTAPSGTKPVVNIVTEVFDASDTRVTPGVITAIADASGGNVSVPVSAPAPGVYTVKSYGADENWVHTGPINTQTVDFPVTFLAVAP